MVQILKSLLPKKLFLDLRQFPILCKHGVVARKARKDIAKLRSGQWPLLELKALKPELVGKPIIWQYWAQGIDNDTLPEVVRHCFASVDKYAGNCQVIRLSDDTIADYVEMPKQIEETIARGGELKKTQYSDLLRLALLIVYGGIWMDATIYLSDYLPERFLKSDIAIYQRVDDAQFKDYWRESYYAYWGWDKRFKVRLLSSIIGARPNNTLFLELLTLVVLRFEESARFLDYFMLHIYYDVLVEEKGFDIMRYVQDDTKPHLLQNTISGGSLPISVPEILATTTIHKMSYYEGEALERFRALVRELAE